MENVLIKEQGQIAELTINRPKALNALNGATLDELEHAISSIEKREDIRAVIITGAGPKAFVAGADIAAMSKMDPIESKNFSRHAQKVFSMIENMPQVVIAAVNGYALGGGCELAMSCDIRIASEKAKFGQPEVNLGILPSFGGTQRLPRLVGKGIAKEMIFTADQISAERAYEIGLVNKVVSADALMDETYAMVQKILSKAMYAVKSAKNSINTGLETDIETGLKNEANLFGLCFTTDDQKEGMNAFLEKRKASFKDF
jgi:enoyl-CoA hydratase